MSVKSKIENFVKKSKIIHKDKYDYSNTLYINSITKLKFKCIKHDISVFMLPGNHLAGKGCRKCAYESSSLKNSKSLDNFIEDANKAHDNFYDYSLVNYINARKKVEIICPTHGNFWQTPDTHLRPSGCMKCKNEKVGKLNALTKEKFIKKANVLHNNKYNYDLVNYKNEHSVLDIICPVHGKFKQKAANHFKSQGCKKCGNENTSKYQKEKPNGWGLSTWVEKSKNAKSFDSFKFYLIECWNEDERFFKIGRTYSTVKHRFRYKTQLPYQYKIIKEIIGTAKEIVKLELNMKELNKNYKYIPKLSFDGRYECYYKINTTDAEYI